MFSNNPSESEKDFVLACDICFYQTKCGRVYGFSPNQSGDQETHRLENLSMAKRKTKSDEVVSTVSLETPVENMETPVEPPVRKSRKVKTEKMETEKTACSSSDEESLLLVADSEVKAAEPTESLHEVTKTETEEPEPFRIAAIPCKPLEPDGDDSVIQLVPDTEVHSQAESYDEPEPFRVVDVPPNSISSDDYDACQSITVPATEKRKDEGYLRLNKPKLGMLMVKPDLADCVESSDVTLVDGSDENDSYESQSDTDDSAQQDMDDFFIVHRRVSSDDVPQDSDEPDVMVPDDFIDEPSDPLDDGDVEEEPCDTDSSSYPSCFGAPVCPVSICKGVSDLPFVKKSSSDKCYLVPDGKNEKLRFERSYTVRKSRPYRRDVNFELEDTCIADMPYYCFDGHVVGMAYEFDPLSGMYENEVYTTRGVYSFRTCSELPERSCSYDDFFQTILNSVILYDAEFTPLCDLSGYDCDSVDSECDDISVVCMGVLEVCGVRYGMRSDCTVDFESVIRALWEIINTDDSDEDLGFYRAYFKRLGD